MIQLQPRNHQTSFEHDLRVNHLMRSRYHGSALHLLFFLPGMFRVTGSFEIGFRNIQRFTPSNTCPVGCMIIQLFSDLEHVENFQKSARWHFSYYKVTVS